jgi:asparagine N-glycosylation enzyme membrane subunit Stt3
MTPAFRYALLWIVGSLVIVVAALAMVSGARVGGEYVPSNADAFYHARRILDVVMTGQAVQQFDSSIHVPEGSWIPWPWGFDTAMAAVVGLFGPFAAESDAAAVLMHLPVVAAVLAVALLVLLWRQLELALPAAVLATFAFAALPLVFLAFAVSPVANTRQFGIGLTVAVVLDASVVRLILLPALIRMFGERTWAVPPWLDRVLPRFSTH